MLTIAPNDPSISWYGRWADEVIESIQTKTTISAGGKFKFKFTGTSLSLNVRLSTEAERPRIAYSVDGGAFATTTVTAPTAIAAGLPDTLHTVEIYCEGVFYTTGANSWNTHEGLMIQGINIDTGRALSAWNTGAPAMLTFGDSITEGLNAQAGGGESVASSCGRQSWSNVLAGLIGVENHVVAFGSQGLTVAGRRGVPDAIDAFPYKMAGINQTDPPAAIVNIAFGANDGYFSIGETAFKAAYRAYIDLIRAAQPTAHFYLHGTLTLGSYLRPYIQAIAGEPAYAGFCTYVDPAAWSVTYQDGVHPNIAGHAAIAGYLSTIISTPATDFTVDSLAINLIASNVDLTHVAEVIADNGYIRAVSGSPIQMLSTDGQPPTIKRYTNNVWQ